jgi:hypothetical protein
MSSTDSGNSGSDGPDAARQLIDLLVYAPIGLLTVAQRELPQLIATGKTRLDNQLTVAKFIGKMAVSQGRKELQRRLDDAQQARQAAAPSELISVPEAAVVAPSEEDVDAALSTGSLPTAIIELVAESPLLAGPSTDELPIEGYDSLAASQVVGRLGSLTDDELALIEAYETAHRSRRTILGKINQLRAR